MWFFDTPGTPGGGSIVERMFFESKQPLWYCIFIQKVLEDLNIFDFLKFLYQQDSFSIGFRPKLKKGYRMLIRDQFPPTKTFRRPCNAAMLYSLSADKEMANIPELLREGFFARYTKSSATTQCSVV